jgi:hypothetical protein
MVWLDAYSSTAAAIAGGRRAGTTIAAPSALGGLPIFFVSLRLDIPYTNSIDEPDLSYTLSGPDESANFRPALTATRLIREDRIMAKRNRTTSTPRRATAAKATTARRRPPVEWGYANGQQIVIRAAGHWQHDLPADRWRGLRNTIDDMDEVVKAFDGTRDIADDSRRLTMLSMAATVARALMLQAAEDMWHALALSPAVRSAIAKVDARMGKGGAA